MEEGVTDEISAQKEGNIVNDSWKITVICVKEESRQEVSLF